MTHYFARVSTATPDIHIDVFTIATAEEKMRAESLPSLLWQKETPAVFDINGILITYVYSENPPLWYKEAPTLCKLAMKGGDPLDYLIQFYYTSLGLNFLNGCSENNLFGDTTVLSSFGVLSLIVQNDALNLLREEYIHGKRRWCTSELLKNLSKYFPKFKECVITLGYSCWGRELHTLTVITGHKSSLLATNVIHKDDNFIVSCELENASLLTCYSGVIMALDAPFEIDCSREFPKFPDKSTISLSSGEYSSLELGKDCTLNIFGDTKIVGKEGHPAIEASGTLIISGVGTLHLVSASHAGCIGESTQYPMSYNRWTAPDRQQLNFVKVTEDVQLVCEEKIPFFTLGGFAQEWMPIVICYDNASIEAPEIKPGFERKIVSYGEHYSSSTKRTGLPVYELVPTSEPLHTTSEFK